MCQKLLVVIPNVLGQIKEYILVTKELVVEQLGNSKVFVILDRSMAMVLPDWSIKLVLMEPNSSDEVMGLHIMIHDSIESRNRYLHIEVGSAGG